MKPIFFRAALVIALLLCGERGGRAQMASVRTLAGSTAPGSASGFGSNARFNLPSGVAADELGNVYVTDTLNGTVRKITFDGYASTFAGLAGNYGTADGNGSSARFYGPQGVAADASGVLYIADTANNTIRKVSLTGDTTTFAGVAGIVNSFDGAGTNAQFYHPEGLALDLAGNLYVADTWNHTIRKVTPAGVVTTLAGLAGDPGSVDGTNSKARFYRPAGIAVDDGGTVFVADSFNHTIRKITPAGEVTTIAGLHGVWGSADGTNSAARFYLPDGIGVTPAGDLIVVDSGNQTLRKISPSGTNWVVSTIAGLSGLAGSSNGTGSSAHFFFPASIACDQDGYLYVADSANNMIRTTRVVPPTLQYQSLGQQFVLSWPVSADGFVLEKRPALDGVGAWSPATNNIVTVGDNYYRTNSVTDTAFYRLRYP